MTYEWINNANVVLLTINCLAAVGSALFASKSNRAQLRSQRIAERQEQLGLADLSRSWAPELTLELTSVSYRWSSNTTMIFNQGKATEPDGQPSESISVAEANERSIHAEIVIAGFMCNRTSEQLIVTLHRGRSGVRYPLDNQSLFMVDGEDRDRFVLAAEERKNFTWVDRRSLSEWRTLFYATEHRSSRNDRYFRADEGFMSWLSTLRKDSRLLWDARVRKGSGFRIVGENRMSVRVANVWSVEPMLSPINPLPTTEFTTDRRWSLNNSHSSSIDDDVVRYRCGFDAVLAQPNPPKLIRVPGRH